LDWEANLVIRWYEREQTRVGVQSVKSWATEPIKVALDLEHFFEHSKKALKRVNPLKKTLLRANPLF